RLVVQDFVMARQRGRRGRTSTSTWARWSRTGVASCRLGRLAFLHLHVLDRDRHETAEHLDRLLVLFVKAVGHLALEAQDSYQLPTDEQRNPELALGIRQAG